MHDVYIYIYHMIFYYHSVRLLFCARAAETDASWWFCKERRLWDQDCSRRVFFTVFVPGSGQRIHLAKCQAHKMPDAAHRSQFLCQYSYCALRIFNRKEDSLPGNVGSIASVLWGSARYGQWSGYRLWFWICDQSLGPYGWKIFTYVGFLHTHLPLTFTRFLQWHTWSWRTPLTLTLEDLAGSVCRTMARSWRCLVAIYSGRHSTFRIAPGPGALRADVWGVNLFKRSVCGEPRCTMPHHCSQMMGCPGLSAKSFRSVLVKVASSASTSVHPCRFQTQLIAPSLQPSPCEDDSAASPYLRWLCGWEHECNEWQGARLDWAARRARRTGSAKVCGYYLFRLRKWDVGDEDWCTTGSPCDCNDVWASRGHHWVEALTMYPFHIEGISCLFQSCSSPSCRSSLTTWESLACRKSVNLRFQAARSIRCSWTASLARTYGTFFHALVLALAGLFKTDLPLPFLGSGKGLKAPRCGAMAQMQRI